MDFVVNIDLRVGKEKGKEGGRQKGRGGEHKLFLLFKLDVFLVYFLCLFFCQHF